MELACLPGCGRSVVATRDFLPGETIFEETAYVMAPCHVNASRTSGGGAARRKKQRLQGDISGGGDALVDVVPPVHNVEAQDTSPGPSTNVCIACFTLVKPSSPAMSSQCPCCHAQYCSTQCVESYAAEHATTGECFVLESIASSPIRQKIPSEDFNTFLVACLVAAKANSEGAAEDLMRCLASSSTNSDDVVHTDSSNEVDDYGVETVGLGRQGPLGLFEDACGGPTSSSFQHMAQLVTNRSTMDDEIRGDFERLHKLYTKFRTASSSVRGGAAGSLVLPDVSFDVFVSICCAFLANGFGLWNAKAVGVATGFFPRSSFFNHSCAPNIGREMNGRRATFFAAKYIATGDAVSLCYIDFKLPREERQMKLNATYSFRCGCPRCSDADAIDYRALYDVALCQDCKSKILRPEVSRTPNRATCPCCKQFFTLEEA